MCNIYIFSLNVNRKSNRLRIYLLSMFARPIYSRIQVQRTPVHRTFDLKRQTFFLAIQITVTFHLLFRNMNRFLAKTILTFMRDFSKSDSDNLTDSDNLNESSFILITEVQLQGVCRIFSSHFLYHLNTLGVCYLV